MKVVKTNDLIVSFARDYEVDGWSFEEEEEKQEIIPKFKRHQRHPRRKPTKEEATQVAIPKPVKVEIGKLVSNIK